MTEKLHGACSSWSQMVLAGGLLTSAHTVTSLLPNTTSVPWPTPVPLMVPNVEACLAQLNTHVSPGSSLPLLLVSLAAVSVTGLQLASVTDGEDNTSLPSLVSL